MVYLFFWALRFVVAFLIHLASAADFCKVLFYVTIVDFVISTLLTVLLTFAIAKYACSIDKKKNLLAKQHITNVYSLLQNLNTFIKLEEEDNNCTSAVMIIWKIWFKSMVHLVVSLVIAGLIYLIPLFTNDFFLTFAIINFITILF